MDDLLDDSWLAPGCLYKQAWDEYDRWVAQVGYRRARIEGHRKKRRLLKSFKSRLGRHPVRPVP